MQWCCCDVIKRVLPNPVTPPQLLLYSTPRWYNHRGAGSSFINKEFQAFSKMDVYIILPKSNSQKCRGFPIHLVKACHSQVQGVGGDGHCVEVNCQVQHLQADQTHHPRLVWALKEVWGPLGSWGHLPVVTALGSCHRGPSVGALGPPFWCEGSPSPRLVQSSCAHVVHGGQSRGNCGAGLVARSRAANWFLWLFSAEHGHQGYTRTPMCTLLQGTPLL